MAMSPYYVQFLINQGDLLSRILSFNAAFSSKQSSLRAQKNPDEIKDSLYKVHPHLAKFHEDNNISYYFENNVDRLCLLRVNELERLLVYLGACVSSNQLANVTNQAEKDLIYNSIGRETYEFALDYGYLIKNLDFMINIDNIKKDCLYLGLCALKCVEPLFSYKELSEFFVDQLINFAKTHDLDPNIVTSKTHVLSVVYNTADLHQAPTPDMMNNPVQYTPVDNHPKLDKPTALGLALQEFDAKAEEERKKAEIDTMAILAKARASVKAQNMAKALQERTDLLNQAMAAHKALIAVLDAQEQKERAQKEAQFQGQDQAKDAEQGNESASNKALPSEQATQDSQAQNDQNSSSPNKGVIKAKQKTLREPLKKTVVRNYSSGPITSGAESDDALSFLMKVQSPDRTDHTQEQQADNHETKESQEASQAQEQAGTSHASSSTQAQGSSSSSAPAQGTGASTGQEPSIGSGQGQSQDNGSMQPNNGQMQPTNELSQGSPTELENQGLASQDMSAYSEGSASADPSKAIALGNGQDGYQSVLSGDEQGSIRGHEPNESENSSLKGPVYGNLSGKDSRILRVASLKQKGAFKELADNINERKDPKPAKNLEEEHLVTLDFNEHQVFNLSYLILYSQIDENWYEYLKN